MKIPKYMSGDLVILKASDRFSLDHDEPVEKRAIVLNSNEWIRLDEDDDGRGVDYVMFIEGRGQLAWVGERFIVNLLGTRKLSLIPEWKNDLLAIKENRKKKSQEKFNNTICSAIDELRKTNPDLDDADLTYLAIDNYKLDCKKQLMANIESDKAEGLRLFNENK